MLALVIIVFSRFLFSDQMLFSSDQMSGFDDRVFIKTSIEKYHQYPPLWVNTRLSGRPSIDALFGDVFYLPSFFINLLASVPRAIGMKMIFHIFLAGVFFFLMLRRGFKMPTLVATTGAIFYMFNPQFVSHIYPGHDGKMFVITWLPFVIWQLKMLMTVSTPAQKIWAMTWVGFGIGMAILSSQIQMTYFVLWGAFLYWVFAISLVLFKENDRKKAMQLSLFFWAAIIIGLGLGAIQLFPSFLYVRDGFSVRGADRGFEYAASWSLHWPEFLSLWVPDFVNTLDHYWGQNPFKLNSEYAGMLPVLLAAMAITLKPKSPWRIFWGSVAVCTVLFALGAHTPVFRIAYAIIPGVKKFRAASMIMFWFSFSTILLSALFLKDVASGFFRTLTEERRKQWLKGLLIAGGICIGLTLLFSVQGFVKEVFAGVLAEQGKERIFELNFSRSFLPFLWVWLIFTLAVLALLRLAIAGKVSAAVFTVAVLLLGIIDIVRVDFHFIKLINPKPYFYRDPALAPLVDEMRIDPFRCFSLPGALPQNGEGIHGLEGIGGFHDNELHWYREFRGDQQDRNFLSSLIGMNGEGQPYLRAERLTEGNPFLNLANARYLLVRNGNKLLTIRNRNALDRLSFVPGYEVMDSSRIVESLSSGAIDYRAKVALTIRPNLPESFARSSDATRSSNALPAEWQRYTPNYRKATVNVPSPGFLRISEVYYPGWEIRLDGKRTTYYRADLAWMALPIPAGKHTIEMVPHSNYLRYFTPLTFGVFGCLLLYWLFIGVIGVKKRK